jgi:lipopolysaccharide transport system ATP-binding protein
MIEKTKIMVISSHDMSIVNELCQRAIWMEKGKVIEDGDVKAISKAYIQKSEKSRS